MLQRRKLTNVQNQSLNPKRREQICEAALSLFLEKGFAADDESATSVRCRASNQASTLTNNRHKTNILRPWAAETSLVVFAKTCRTLADYPAGSRPVTRRNAFEEIFSRESCVMKRTAPLLAYRMWCHNIKAEDRRARACREFRVMKDPGPIKLGVATGLVRARPTNQRLGYC